MRTNRRRCMKSLEILPCIEGTSDQYIDTEVKPFKDIDFYYDIEYTSIKLVDTTFSIPTFGVCGSTYGWQKESFYILYRNDTKNFNIRAYNASNAHEVKEDCPLLSGRFQIRMSYSRWQLIQENKIVVQQTLNGVYKFPNLSIYIGNKHDSSNNNSSMKAYYKIYGCKIYHGELLIRDFVPAKYNGRKGMFETIGKKFYGFKKIIYDQQSMD